MEVQESDIPATWQEETEAIVIVEELTERLIAKSVVSPDLYLLLSLHLSTGAWE